MKSLKDILNKSLLNESLLNESLLDDEDELFDRNDKILMELWIKENYKIHGTLKIYEDKHGFVVDSNDNVEVTNKDIKSLTNGMFRWGKITGGFNCESCEVLISLEGAPSECYDFNCSYCTGLRSLKGAPNECKWFGCSDCTELRSLEGSLKNCDSFDCSGCIKLTSLKGAPKKLNEWFCCTGCIKLTSLKGAPKDCPVFYCNKLPNLTSLEGLDQYNTIYLVDSDNVRLTEKDMDHQICVGSNFKTF